MCFFSQFLSGITPACARSTPEQEIEVDGLQDHPRLRGEYAAAIVAGIQQGGSPPLARGVQCLFDRAVVMQGITPACAGSTWFILEQPHQGLWITPACAGSTFIHVLFPPWL